MPSTLISSPSTSTPGRPAVRRVVAEQVREDVGRREIVHGDDVEVAAALRCARTKFRPIRPKPLMPTLSAMRLPRRVRAANSNTKRLAERSCREERAGEEAPRTISLSGLPR